MSVEVVSEFLKLFWWLVAVPFVIGFIPCGFMQKKMRTCGMMLAAGYLVMFSVFEVVVLPMVIAGFKFTTAVTWVSFVLMLVAAVGTAFAIRAVMKKKSSLRGIFGAVGVNLPKGKPDIQAVCLWCLFGVLVGFQLYQAFTLAVFDGDDAYYVALSVTAVNRDSMYGYIPYNGFGTSLDIRHAIAVLPMWIAFLAKHSGIHATIISHLILPFIFVPLTYLSYYLVAKRLLAGKQRLVPAFLIIVGIFQIFGNVSIYTKETFFVMRTWQGKSFFSNFVLTMTLALILWLFPEGRRQIQKKNPGLWVLLFCVNITAAFSTALGVFLTAILIGITGLCLAVRNRNLRILWKFAASCIPCVVFTLIYLGLS